MKLSSGERRNKLGRYNVKYNGKWAAFSTIVDDFITPFMEKEQYEKWRLEEYGRTNYVPVEQATIESISEAVSSIRLNRSHDETLKCLCKAGICETDAEKYLYDLETERYCPVPIGDGKYECPNCGEIVVSGQERCIDETCDLEFVWR